MSSYSFFENPIETAARKKLNELGEASVKSAFIKIAGALTDKTYTPPVSSNQMSCKKTLLLNLASYLVQHEEQLKIINQETPQPSSTNHSHI
ncbi:MAG: hypothetical protein QNK11_05045 [Legionella sp.]|nr:hypothetical protein [Legionella sp.]